MTDDSTRPEPDSEPVSMRFTLGGGRESAATGPAVPPAPALPAPQIPDMAFGHAFTPQEKQLLQSGYVLYAPNLVSETGQTYEADLILNRQSGRVEFFKGVPTHFHGVPLDEGQRGALANGMIVYLPRLIGPAGEPYEADIVWNQQEARLEFFQGVPTHFRGAPLSPDERRKLESGYKIKFKGLLDPDPYYRQRGKTNPVYLRFDPQTGRLRNVGVPLEYLGIPLTYSNRIHLSVGDDVTVSVPGEDGEEHENHVLAWDEKQGVLYRRDFRGYIFTEEELQQLDDGKTIYVEKLKADIVRDPQTGRIDVAKDVVAKDVVAKDVPSHYKGYQLGPVDRHSLSKGEVIRVLHSFIYWDADEGRIKELTYEDMPRQFDGIRLTDKQRRWLAAAEITSVTEGGEYYNTIYEVQYSPDGKLKIVDEKFEWL